MADLLVDIARHVSGIRFADLPERALRTAKLYLLDTLACSLAGTTAPGCREVRGLVEGWGGAPECAVIASEARVLAPSAALINAMFTHARDFDDTHDAAIIHANVTSLPAAMAVAELRGRSGRDLLLAVTVGVDLSSRIASSLGRLTGWHRTAVCGVFGAAAAAAKLCGFAEARTAHAVGIAYSLASGHRQGSRDGSLTKRMQAGFAARAGVEAALFADAGINGPVEVFEGECGFFPLFAGGDYRRETVLDGLGERFLVEELSMKPYPACRFTHPVIDGALALRSAHGVRAEEVERLMIRLPRLTMPVVGRPFVPWEQPQVDAQFSAAYTAACALLRGEVGLLDFEADALRSPERLSLVERTEVAEWPVEDPDAFFPVRVGVRLKGGAEKWVTVREPKGHPTNPCTEEEVRRKFRRCAEYASRPISGEALSSIEDFVLGLEERTEEGSAGRLAEMLAAKEPALTG